jgi:hypothetical protein
MMLEVEVDIVEVDGWTVGALGIADCVGRKEDVERRAEV